MSLADDVEVAVAGRPGVVAVGVGAELLPALFSARRRTRGRRWRVACPPDVVADPEELHSALRAQFAVTTDGSNSAEPRGDDPPARDRRR